MALDFLKLDFSRKSLTYFNFVVIDILIISKILLWLISLKLNNLFLKVAGLINEYLIISENPQFNSLLGREARKSGQIKTFLGK